MSKRHAEDDRPRMKGKKYEKELRKLQTELCLLQDWVKREGLRVIVVLEGRDAAVKACQLRLRPILMTSFAFILGVVPLALSTGAGAEMRRPLGIAVFSGMLGVTFFGLFLTPVFYYVLEWLGGGAVGPQLPELEPSVHEAIVDKHPDGIVTHAAQTQSKA